MHLKCACCNGQEERQDWIILKKIMERDIHRPKADLIVLRRKEVDMFVHVRRGKEDAFFVLLSLVL